MCTAQRWCRVGSAGRESFEVWWRTRGFRTGANAAEPYLGVEECGGQLCMWASSRPLCMTCLLRCPVFGCAARLVFIYLSAASFQVNSVFCLYLFLVFVLFDFRLLFFGLYLFLSVSLLLSCLPTLYSPLLPSHCFSSSFPSTPFLSPTLLTSLFYSLPLSLLPYPPSLPPSFFSSPYPPSLPLTTIKDNNTINQA